MNKKSILAVIALFAAVCLVFGACSDNHSNPSENDTKENNSATDENGETSTGGGSADTDVSSGANAASGDSELIHEIYGENGEYPYITLEADKNNLSPGDTVNVVLRINNAENLACFDMKIKFDSSVLSLLEYDEANISGFIFETVETSGGLLFSGITARTADFDGEDVMTLTFNVKSGASADSTVISANASEFKIGTDKSGDIIADLTAVQDVSGECAIAITL